FVASVSCAAIMFFLSFFALLSFPTRRSSDLVSQQVISCSSKVLAARRNHRTTHLGVLSSYVLLLFLDNAHIRLLQEESLPVYFQDRKSTRLNSSHVSISYAVFFLKKKKHLY